MEVYKKKVEEIAQTKNELKECQAENQRMREDIEVMQREKANIKDLRSAIDYLEE